MEEFDSLYANVKYVEKHTNKSLYGTEVLQDEDGDNVSVTCCRTTYQEAYDCAAAKLRKACGLEENPGLQ